MLPRRIALKFLVVAALLTSAPPARAEGASPPGVPDLTDPARQEEYRPLALSQLNEDPDFPMLLLARLVEGSPPFLLVIYDARNGKDTWSLREDAAVFYALFADLSTVQQAFLDEGFAGKGKPSGQFLAAGPDEVEALMARLQESHQRSRGVARMGLGI